MQHTFKLQIDEQTAVYSFLVDMKVYDTKFVKENIFTKWVN